MSDNVEFSPDSDNTIPYEVPGDFKLILTFFHRLVILLLVILFFKVIVDINIGVLAYLTQFIIIIIINFERSGDQ
jgi:hypothetical protein